MACTMGETPIRKQKTLAFKIGCLTKSYPVYEYSCLYAK